MLKLRYLFDNGDLARMLLANWEYDAGSLDMFKYFRISSNAVYPFRAGDEVRLLRFSPAPEKDWECLQAELGFVRHLRSCGYPALATVPAKSGEECVRRDTPWGVYHACVFRRVPGRRLDDLPLDRGLLSAYGASLGRLHELSRQYSEPAVRRWSHADALAWIDGILAGGEDGRSARAEVALLERFFADLPQGRDVYGLVHYDFELDNVFFDDATGTCHVIDFDDAMYHWYAMDIVQALDSVAADGELAGVAPEEARGIFLEGYRRESQLPEGMLRTFPAFSRFAALYGYARIARAIRERWENEPEWLAGLRLRLDGELARRAARFGAPIER